MANYNNDILIWNVRKLMEDNHMTQQNLANVLNMSQSNVSKALSTTDKKCFTLDQVVGIAKHFGVSVDSLLGNRNARFTGVNEREIAAFIAKLLEEHKGLLKKEVIEEDQYFFVDDNPHNEVTHQRAQNEYYFLYFPEYWPLPECDPVGDVELEYQCRGNRTYLNDINVFLRAFKEIFEIYERRGISKDTYNMFLRDLLSQLSDVM